MDAWNYLPGTSGDAWERMYGTPGDAWERLPGDTGDAWERLLFREEDIQVPSVVPQSAGGSGPTAYSYDYDKILAILEEEEEVAIVFAIQEHLC